MDQVASGLARVNKVSQEGISETIEKTATSLVGAKKELADYRAQIKRMEDAGSPVNYSVVKANMDPMEASVKRLTEELAELQQSMESLDKVATGSLGSQYFRNS